MTAISTLKLNLIQYELQLLQLLNGVDTLVFFWSLWDNMNLKSAVQFRTGTTRMQTNSWTAMYIKSKSAVTEYKARLHRQPPRIFLFYNKSEWSKYSRFNGAG